MTRLSVNINKVATLRNARGENVPDVEKFAADCESFGAQGITVHPRPDERHITRRDALALREIVKTEYNIEGYPSEEFMELVEYIRPEQCTLVPDAPGVLTSSEGWDVEDNYSFLSSVVSRLKQAGIRVSIFVAPEPRQIKAAAALGADRVELYTKPYADAFTTDPEGAVAPFAEAARVAAECGLGVNAGHDLNKENLAYFHRNVVPLHEVSIGHAIISDALYLGIRDTIRIYLEALAEE